MVGARHGWVALVALAAGCQCGFDAGKLDDLACHRDADCAPGQICFDGTCARDDCTLPADCGDGFAFRCDDGHCQPVECEVDDDCPRGFGCVGQLCVAGAGPCTLHADCDDAVWCNGAELCVDGRCEAGPAPDCGLQLAPCEVAVCDEATHTCSPAPADDGEPCEDGDPCTGPDTCTDQVCRGVGDACDDDLTCTPGECVEDQGCVVEDGACAIDGACWEAGDPNPADPCLACDPSLDALDWSPGPAAPCDDGNDCTSNDTCAGGACAGRPYACDDGLACTTDRCDGTGRCIVEPAPFTCLIAGACHADGDPNPLDPCEACDADADPAGWTPDDAAVPLDDGIACTTGTCLGGQAVHTPDDALCNGGQVCAPCAGGCATPPTLLLDCGGDPVTPGGVDATCALTGSADTACLSCTAQAGITALVRNDFTGCPRLDQLGWETDGMEPDCNEGVLYFDDTRYTEVSRIVDTRGFDSVRMCFQFLDVGMGNEDSVAIELDTGLGFREVWSHAGGPFSQTDYVSTAYCVDLVAADPLAADNDSLGVRLVIDATLCVVAIDDLAIDGWVAATIAQPGRVVDDDFTGCDLGGWVEGRDGVTCPGTIEENDGVDLVEVHGDTAELSQVVDLSDRCDDLRVGFSTGADGGYWPRDVTTLWVDAGFGEEAVWIAGAGVRPNSLQAVEMILSHALPGLHFQPAVTFHFEVHSGAAQVTQWLDDVWIDGATCGSADGIVTIGAVSDLVGNATVPVSSDQQTTAHLSCRWDGRPSTTARDPVVFRY